MTTFADWLRAEWAGVIRDRDRDVALPQTPDRDRGISYLSGQAVGYGRVAAKLGIELMPGGVMPDADSGEFP